MKQITDAAIDLHYSHCDPCHEDHPECPECGSYDIDVVIDEPDGSGYMECKECGRR